MAPEGKPATGPSSPRSSPSLSPSNILPSILPNPPPRYRPLNHLRPRPHHPNPLPSLDPSSPMPPRSAFPSSPSSSAFSASSALNAFLRSSYFPFSIFHFRRKPNASPTSTLLVNNPFLSPTYAKTKGYPLPKTLG